MPLTILPNKIRFSYKSKNWQYDFDEIKEIGLLKKRKKYYLENAAFAVVTAITYYCMLFSDIMDLYYIIPAILCYTIIITVRFSDPTEFVYFVFVKDIYQNEIKTKIESKDRALVGKQIDYYLDLQFERNIQKNSLKELKMFVFDISLYDVLFIMSALIYGFFITKRKKLTKR